MENALRILPNTTVIDTTVTVHARAFGPALSWWELREVALDAGGEVVVLGTEDAQVRLAALTRPPAASSPNRGDSLGHSAATSTATAQRARSARASPHLNLSPTLEKAYPGRNRMSQKMTIKTLATSARTPTARRQPA